MEKIQEMRQQVGIAKIPFISYNLQGHVHVQNCLYSGKIEEGPSWLDIPG